MAVATLPRPLFLVTTARAFIYDFARVARRYSAIKLTRDIAAELRPFKSLELESRVARLELVVERLRDAQGVTNERLVALQARLDHIAGRLGII